MMGRVVTLLSHYFQPDTDPAVVRAIAEDWWDVLAPYPEAAVAQACKDYLRDEPKVRPTPGAIRSLAIKAMAADPRLAPPALPKPPEPERVRVTPEAAARILHEAGLTPQRMAAIANGRRMPPPNMPGYEEPPPERPKTIEEIVARPYTDAERARMVALRPPPPAPAEEGRA